jgi:hypothetical protein
MLLLLLWVANNACGGRPVTLPVVCIPFQGVLAVTSVEDSGPGSLREAINKANESPGPSVINFNLPKDRLRIRLRSPLPPIRDAVTINGFNQRGGRVELDGANAGPEANGLTIIGSGNTIQGLVIYSFTSHGVLISGRISGDKAIKNQVADNFIGTDAKGIKGPGNDKDGVFVDLKSSDSLITRNHIAYNKGNGVNLQQGDNYPVRINIDDNLIFGNYRLGIDLGNDGRTLNDTHIGDPNGPNNWQTFPVLRVIKTTKPPPGYKGFGLLPSVSAALVVTLNISLPNPVPGVTYTFRFYYCGSCTNCDPCPNVCLGCVSICPNCKQLGCSAAECNPPLAEAAYCVPVRLHEAGEVSAQAGVDGLLSVNRSFTLPNGFRGVIYAKAKRQNNNTSEFSDCVRIQ